MTDHAVTDDERRRAVVFFRCVPDVEAHRHER
jgi:hypothetical protein